MKKAKPYLLLLLLAITVGCKKLQLTKKTEKGADTFSCIVDGKIFKSCFGGLFSDPPLRAYAGLYYGEPIATVSASCNEKMPYKDFYIELHNFHGEGRYALSDSINFCRYEERYPDKRYKAAGGEIKITKDDRASRILSGTFECTLVDVNNPSEKIRVKSGRFDINYK